MEQVRVKNIAKALNSSVQPIYSYCTNMEGLREAVERRVRQFVKAYIGARLNGADLFQSTGRAYIALAQEEPHILKIFLLQKRRGIASLEALYREEADPKIAQSIAREQSISEEKARKLHLLESRVTNGNWHHFGGKRAGHTHRGNLCPTGTRIPNLSSRRTGGGVISGKENRADL